MITKIAKSSLDKELEPLRNRLEGLISKNMAGRTEPITVVPGVIMAQSMSPLPPTAHIYEPSLCICVRGRKTVLFGNETFFYDENHYLLTCVDIPTIVSIAKASEKNPYSGILIRLDMEMVRSIIGEMEISGAPLEYGEAGVAIRTLNSPLLEAICRLAELTANQKDIPIMAPLIQREILYRLLSGPSGDRLRGIAQYGSQTNRVGKALSWIRENFAKKISIEDLADIAAMGVSTFHRHFQELTTMSPIQYQKHLRLHEARRLMLVENEDAASSAVLVGYESVTQFNREYRRLFGAPPAADKKKLISAGRSGGAAV
jgi:AraC-like DNA-binding protein